MRRADDRPDRDDVMTADVGVVPGKRRVVPGTRRSGPPTVGADRSSRFARVASTVLRNEWSVVALTLVALEMLIFSGYFSGRITAPWDFLGTYNAEAFAWWREGSFLHPTQWMPYQWGGYPAAASIQNSAWYLPVGIVSALVPFTIHAASVVHAVHVGWGALGLYCLVRRWGIGRSASLLGLVAYFFGVGFYSNAQHVDIARAFSWTPWILVCVSSVWCWRRWWGVPFAGLVFWQAAISSYPGILVQLAYAILAWVAVNQLVVRPRPRVRDYLGPLLVAGTGAILLCVVKFLPVLLTRGTGGSTLARGDVFDLGIIGTFFYQYDLDFLGNDVTMRSFFVVAPVVPLMFLARFSQPLVRAALALLAVGVVLGVPGPWAGLVDMLPGMELSRFQLADSRVLVVVACILLGVAGLDRLTARTDTDPWVVSGRTVLPAEGLRRRRRLAVVCVPVVALLVARIAGFPDTAWVVPWALVLLSCVVVLTVTHLPEPGEGELRDVARGLTATVLLLAVVSGGHWAHANLRPWQVEREAQETAQWGSTSGALVLARSPLRDLERRPERAPLPDPADDAVARSATWSAGFYSGDLAVGGYANLVGVPSFEAIRTSVLTGSANAADARAFWSAPGVVMSADSAQAPSADAVQRCVESDECGGGVTALATGYDLDTWTYEVRAAEARPIVFNEAYYPGFTLWACPADGGRCEGLDVDQHGSGAVTAQVPAGTWDLTLAYATPGQETGWRAFVAGLAVLVAWPLVLGVSGWVRRTRSPAAPRGTRRSP